MLLQRDPNTEVREDTASALGRGAADLGGVGDRVHRLEADALVADEYAGLVAVGERTQSLRVI
jgi:hypothetical protein